jgi:thioredoxin-like negative regulator of GroEL
MKQVLYFSAPWCGPCRSFKPVMESLQTEMSITFVDVDSSPQTAQQYNVRSVPTTVVLNNGMEIGRVVGARTKDEIRSLYNR